MVIATLDNSNSPNLWAYTWNGTSVPADTAVLLSATAAGSAANTPSYEAFDIAWEGINRQAFVIWADNYSTTYVNRVAGTTDRPLYAVFVSTKQAWETTNLPQMAHQDANGGDAESLRQVRAAGDPTSNVIIAGITLTNNSNNLTLNAWSGSSWTTTAGTYLRQQITGVDQYNYHAFDVGFDANDGNAVITFAAGAQSGYRTWTGAGFSAANTNFPSTFNNTPAVMTLYPDTINNNQYLLATLTQGRLVSLLWNGTVFNTPTLFGAVGVNEGVNQNQTRWEPFTASWNNDILPPQTVVTVPAANVFYTTNTLLQLQGTAADPAPEASGVNTVYVQLSRSSDGKCWNGNPASPGNWFTCPLYFAMNGTNNWSLTSAIPSAQQNNVWSDGLTYTLTSTATDNVGNVSAPNSVSFFYDNTPATGTITFPLSTGPVSGFYKRSALTTWTGVALDTTVVPSGAISGVSSIVLSLQRSGGNWWNGATWQVGQTSFSTSTYNGVSGGWTYSMPSLLTNLSDATTYTFSIQVRDGAGNWMASGSTVTFVVDESSPTVGLTLPGVNGGSYQPFTTIKGTAADPDAFTLKTTSISIQNPGVGCWDNISAFTQSCPYWITAVGTATWSYAFPTASFNGANLTISVLSLNVAGGFTNPPLSQSFIIDNSTPTAGVTVPTPSGVGSPTWISQITQISGTALDANINGELGAVHLRLRRFLDNKYWAGAGWGSPTQLTATLSGPANSFSQTWTFPFNAAQMTTPFADVTGSSFTVWATASNQDLDQFNNSAPFESSWTLVSQATFYWDVDPPTTTITSPLSLSTLGQGATTFFGGMYDANSGINRVEYEIQRQSDGLFWLGGTLWGGQPGVWPAAT
jgi:hypothetical protein